MRKLFHEKFENFGSFLPENWALETVLNVDHAQVLVEQFVLEDDELFLLHSRIFHDFHAKLFLSTASLPSVSKPNITRLNDESVMVKWSVLPSSSDSSLPIQFFKVQYMMVPSDSQKHKGHKSNEDWITLNEDIPPHLRSYEIPHLRLGHHYKFRLSAVYSNNDNKQSPIRRFHLKRVNQSSKAALPVPNDIQIMPVSENEVTVRWSIPEPFQHNFDGFYISYRPTTSADEYSIVSAEGPHKRHIVIKHLESGMNYEFKIQSFTSLTASEFSSIVMGRTMSKLSLVLVVALD